MAQVQHGGGGPAGRDKSPCKRHFCLWVDWLIGFYEEREKAMCQLCVDCKKCDRKKQLQGGLCGGHKKDRASPELRGAGIFCGWGFCPAELPVIIYQVKPDRFLAGFLPLLFLPISQLFTFEFQKTTLGCGVAVAEGIKAFAVKHCGDFAPQLN